MNIYIKMFFCLYNFHRMGLESKMHRTFDLLSKGERQNVLIARALISNPQMLILDEPGTGLDVFARELQPNAHLFSQSTRRYSAMHYCLPGMLHPVVLPHLPSCCPLTIICHPVSKLEVYCSHCKRIEYGVEPEIYEVAEYFVDELSFDYYKDLDIRLPEYLDRSLCISAKSSDDTEQSGFS